MARVKLSAEDEQKIKDYGRVFDQYDKDRSGHLDRAEIKQLLASKPSNPNNPTPTVDQIFELADEDSNGKVTKEEFLSALVGVTKEKQYAYMFRTFDSDHDGKVDASEMLKALGQKETPETLRSVKKLIAEMDVNGDGKLDPAEFAKKFGKLLAGK